MSRPQLKKKPEPYTRRQVATAAALLVAAGLIVAGVALLSLPAAFIVAGVLLAAWSLLVVLEA